MTYRIRPYRFRPQVWELEDRFTPAVLSDNLSAATEDVVTATGDTYQTSSFSTDASNTTLTDVILLLSNTTTGTAAVDIYTDSANAPGSLVGTLTSPSSYSSSLAATTFTSSGLTLAAGTTYWVVLRATSGEFAWAYTLDNTGSGDGFQGTYGESTDAGANWFTGDIFPTQMSVTATGDGTSGAAGSIAFGTAAYSVTEGGSLSLTFTRTGGSTGAVSVPLTVTSGSATSGADYSGLPATVSFADGATTATVSLAVTDDATTEAAETIAVALGTPTGGATLGGQTTATVTIADNDGGTSPPTTTTTRLTAVAAGSGDSTVKVYNADGTLRYTLTPFAGFTGGTRVATADVTGDGVDDIVAGAGPGGTAMVKVFDGSTGTQIASFTAFEAAFAGGVYVAAGDTDADGFAEVVVTPDQGGGPVVAIYSGAGLRTGTVTQTNRFLGIDDSNFRGGARAALGDMNSDGQADLIVAAGFGGGPRVAIFNATSLTGTPTRLMNDFFAFETELRNGAFVATGEGSGVIAFGGGPGGGPRVRVFTASGLMAGGFATLDAAPSSARVADFFAGDTSLRGGVRVAMADLTNDGTADLVTASGDGQASDVNVYTLSALAATASPTPTDEFDPFGTTLTGGVFVG